jgi:hypothetical protein
MPRQRHPNKELERLLRRGEDQKWRVERGRKYFVMYCPCKEKHYKTVHLTPSDSHYERNLRSRLRSTTCWKENQP